MALTSRGKEKEGAKEKTSEEGEKKANVLVCVRVRPMNRLELRTKQVEAWAYKDDCQIVQTVLQEEKKSEKKSNNAPKITAAEFTFDILFTPDKDNRTVYNKIGFPVVEDTMQGYHGCIFAYGQTSSGKTHTIHGYGDQPGMIPLSVQHIFNYIEDHPEREFVLRVSYMEIYNEVVNDLLNPANTNLKIREDKKLGVFVEGLKEEVVISESQVVALLQAGTSHRHIGRTNYNDVSSRSHTIFRLLVESTTRGARGSVRISALNLVDLAGSENAVKAGSDERQKETGYINKSLLTLGHVIYKLAENNQDHIPYRDSKLTRILQSSLEGRARVSVCCNISPSSGNIEETISTLKFASRAKRIVSTAKINEKMDADALLVKYREEIELLKQELNVAREETQKLQDETREVDKAKARMKFQELEQKRNENIELTERIEKLTRLILTSSQAVPAKRDAPPAQPVGLETQPDEDTQVDNASTKDANEPFPVQKIEKKKAQLYGTLPRNFGQPGKRPTITHLFESTQDLPHAADKPLSAEGKTVEELRNELAQLKGQWRAALDEVKVIQDQNIQLQRTIDEQNNELQDWDRLRVTDKNKHAAVRDALRRIAAESDDNELNGLFNTLEMDESFDAPLVSFDEPPKTKSGKFSAIVSKFKSLEQE